MQTKKMSVGELKTLKIFSAISSTGKEATFEVNGDYAVDIVTDKKVKLDSIRRSWKIIVGKKEEENNLNIEEKNEVVSTESNEVTSGDVPTEQVEQQVTSEEEANTEQAEVVEEVAEVEPQIEVGSVVQLADGREGIVLDEFHGRLTIDINDGETEESAMIEEVTLLKKKAPKKPKASAPKEPKEPKPERAVRGTRAVRYAEHVASNEPTTSIETENQTKQTFFIREHEVLEYIFGTVEKDGKPVKWEMMRVKNKSSWHGVFFKVDGNIIKEAVVGGRTYPEMRKSKTAVKGYLQENFGTTVEL